MNIETAKIAEKLLYDLKIAEQRLRDIQGNIEHDDLKISGKNSIYLSNIERKEVGKLIEDYYQEKINQITNKITEL